MSFVYREPIELGKVTCNLSIIVKIVAAGVAQSGPRGNKESVVSGFAGIGKTVLYLALFRDHL